MSLPALSLAALGLWANLLPAAATYSWQEPQAAVVSTGDLAWTPRPYVYQAGTSVRYIDYENGDDSRSGDRPDAAFQHHPWDPRATGQAKATSGIHTYVFKRGVVYRGTLTASASGQPGNPIRLTSDPAWGEGEAALYGSERITSGWQRCTEAQAPKIPDFDNVWYIDLPFTIEDATYGSAGTPYCEMVCEVVDGELQRLDLARAPNWTVSDPDYPQKNWWTVATNGILTIQETFPQTAAADWIGGTVWSNYGVGGGGEANMATFQQGRITAYSAGSITIDIQSNPGCKYYVENLPQLLDSPNEFYYSPAGAFPRRLYVRLSGDRDPNTAILEVGARNRILRIVDKHDLVISGLSFGVNNQPRPGIVPEPPHWNCGDGNNQALELSGTCTNIEISHCRFRHVVMAIAQRRDDGVASSAFDQVSITDNDIAHVEDQAVTLSIKGSPGYLRRCQVLRNRVSHTGYRQTCRGYSSLPAMYFNGATSLEVAGNVVDTSWGQGINVVSAVGNTAQPGSQVRTLVHHNKVTRSLLGTNDWGGIEGWGQGPAFFWNNVSGNARGYRSFTGDFSEWNPWGHAIYFDHAFHHKAFNNIVWGVGNNANDAKKRNGSGFMQAASNHLFYANNTLYKLYRGFCFSSEGCLYLGNLLQDITLQFHDEGSTLSWTGYANNAYFGNPQRFNPSRTTLANFQQYLQSGSALRATVGHKAAAAILTNPAASDFRPTGEALQRGARVFVPWTLPQVRGEWHFHAHPADYATLASDDNPSGGTGNTLVCTGALATDFIAGDLEDWTTGALRLDGSRLSCRAASSSPFNMTTNGFLVELYFRSTAAGTLLSKADSKGYRLALAADGFAEFTVTGTSSATRRSSQSVHDGQWHHLLAEFDRSAGTLHLYLDGALADGPLQGTLPAAGDSLSNSANLYLGQDNAGQRWAGDLDFVRVAAATLAQGETSYEELFAWQFAGPAQRDFTGRLVQGTRHAGAIHFTEPPVLTLSSFTAAPGSQSLTWPGQAGWQYHLWRSSNLVDWVEVETLQGEDGPMNWSGSAPSPVFYRLEALLP